jgi:tetratricopeptide (TPR) repeat protein
MYDARDDGTPARRDSARVAAVRAFALDSTLPEAALALGQIEERQWGAVERFIVALRTNPNNPELLHALGVQQLALGRTSDALASFTRAAALDPRSPDWLAEIANIHDIRHAYDDAVRVRERQIALDPTNAAAYVAQALSLINARGDTAAARRTLARGIGVAGRARLVQLLSGGSGVRVTPVLWSALDAETRRAIDTLSVAGARRPPWRVFRLKAQHFEREGRTAEARAYHDSTVAAVLSALRDRPADPELHETLGLAYAGLGRADDALREGRRAVALDTADVEERPWTRFTLAMIAARVGAPDVSLEALERGLPVSIPSVSAYWLRLDPRWAPMRDLPRFRRLLDAAPDRRDTATSSR